MNDDAETRARVQEHWAASERGDTDVEHVIYAVDAVLDYPQSGERFAVAPKSRRNAAAIRRIDASPSAGSAAEGRCG